MRSQLIDFLVELNNNQNGVLLNVDVSDYVDKIQKNANIISIFKNEKLKAFIAFYDNDKNREFAFLTMIAVEKGSENLGYGKTLLGMSIKEIEKKGFKEYRLEVKSGNLKAINLYKKFGFEIVSVLEGVLYMKKHFRL